MRVLSASISELIVLRLVFKLVLIPVAIAQSVFAYMAFIALDSTAFGERDGLSYRNRKSAMSPTLLPGEVFTARSLRGRKGELLAPIHRGDVIAYLKASDPEALARRVVAIGGDTVDEPRRAARERAVVRQPYALRADADDPVVVDLFRWQRSFLVGDAAANPSSYQPSFNTWGPLSIPRGHYFVLGDNRDSSSDSRVLGLLPTEYVVGEVRRVAMSRNGAGAIRWRRLGARIR